VGQAFNAVVEKEQPRPKRIRPPRLEKKSPRTTLLQSDYWEHHELDIDQLPERGFASPILELGPEKLLPGMHFIFQKLIDWK
jgi:hypothetical protein